MNLPQQFKNDHVVLTQRLVGSTCSNDIADKRRPILWPFIFEYLQVNEINNNLKFYLLERGLDNWMTVNSTVTWTRIIFSFPRYTFSFDKLEESEEVLIIRPTMYFLIPKSTFEKMLKRFRDCITRFTQSWLTFALCPWKNLPAGLNNILQNLKSIIFCLLIFWEFQNGIDSSPSIGMLFQAGQNFLSSFLLHK